MQNHAIMRLWPAKIRQHAVAHEFGDVALKAANLTGATILITSDDLAHLLWVEAGRQRRRADEIGEHHGQLPALGTGRGHGCRREFRDLCGLFHTFG
jgi:hypothetical protein